MVKHLFKMIWNKKKQNALLISEMLISFMVLFAVFTLLVFDYQNYQKPMGFEYENVWVVNYSNPVNIRNADSLKLFYETLKQTVKALPQVKEISYSSNNFPFSNSTSQSGFTYGKIHIDHINWYHAGDSYMDVLNVNLNEGRWFSKEDIVSKNRPVVINAALKEMIFGNESAIGKLIGSDWRDPSVKDKDKMRVIGVVRDMKMKGDYANPGVAVYNRVDTGEYRWLNSMLVSVTPGAGAAFEEKLYKTLANAMSNSNIEIEHLADKRVKANYFSVVPIIVMLIVAGFLVCNVALGLFGVLWYNINKRRGEIGLRRAVGASGKSVTWQLIGEAMVVATFSLIVGSFFAIQFPLLNVFDLSSNTYFIALALSIVFIYLLVLVCALYPGRQAAGIYPAVALHED
ncbi:MAG: FtsX-like permease family protein [Chitinophagaceae bacterium]